jgi:hypothetical protein
MKKIVITTLGLVGLTLLSVSAAMAASLTLTNGGLGQAAANPQEFGVAVCAGNSALTQSVPVTVSVGSQSATVSSAASIAAGSCEYTYLPYSQLAMQAGQTYTVNVTVDPQHTISANSNNETAYGVTVPTQPVAETAQSKNLTADVASQFPNPFTVVWGWITGFFHWL